MLKKKFNLKCHVSDKTRFLSWKYLNNVFGGRWILEQFALFLDADFGSSGGGGGNGDRSDFSGSDRRRIRLLLLNEGNADVAAETDLRRDFRTFFR